MVSLDGQVLVLNCGSSSIKYQLLQMDGGRVLAGGLVERIGEAQPMLTHRCVDGVSGEQVVRESVIEAGDHAAAFEFVDAALRELPAFEAGRRLLAVGHRVVHGGEAFSAPTLIDAGVMAVIDGLSDLAPLHNPPNLVGIRIGMARFPGVPHVAVFDTAFHQSMPAQAFRYAVPAGWYSGHGVRRYGFHGSSHRFVANRAAGFLGRPLGELKLVSLHLGNGASAAAIDGGRCVDTSMGFTPLEGLVMGTRCGDVDPAVSFYMQERCGLSAEAVEGILNRESGLKGLCGFNDMRDVLHAAEAGDAEAELALEVYCYRIRKYVGAYVAVLGGLDGLIFTGGVGENSAEVRRRVCKGLGFFGVGVDVERNACHAGAVLDIGIAGSGARVLVVRTNEELQIANETLHAIRGCGS